jgi:hypothetical protein
MPSMTEGWRGDDYFILFSASEVPVQSDRYGIAEFLPGYSVLGPIGWDDFIVQDAAGSSGGVLNPVGGDLSPASFRSCLR